MGDNRALHAHNESDPLQADHRGVADWTLAVSRVVSNVVIIPAIDHVVTV